MFNGLSEFINEISAGVVFWILNLLLLRRLGVDGVAAFSVVSYYIFLSLMLSYGIADAVHLVVSQNFGAGNRDRLRSFLRTALASSLLIGAALSAILYLFRGSVTGWFLDEADAHVASQAVELVLVVWPLFVVKRHQRDL